MPTNSSASMFGGAGGRGARASVASLEGLRNVLRNETDRDSAPAPAVPKTAAPAAAQAPPASPADDKQTLRGLNDRLSSYLGRVRQLEKENGDLEKEIDEILAKRKVHEGRNWDEVEKPLDDLKKQIKEITMDNAKLLLQIDNTKMANDDFTNKLEDEKKACKELENDVDALKKTNEETKLNCNQMQKEIDLVKEELTRLEEEHKKVRRKEKTEQIVNSHTVESEVNFDLLQEVDVLREKVKDSDVNVEIDSPNSNLAEVLNKIRSQYDKLAVKNLKETEEWYQSKFDNIKVVEAQNTEVLMSGKSDLKELIKQKQYLEIKIQSLHSMVYSLEETMKSTQVEYGQRLAPLNKLILDLEKELKAVRSQVERLVENNKDLLCVKMKLEAEIENYQKLIHGMTADTERSGSEILDYFDDVRLI
ncbi:Keratin [Nibea albiflora]|uniref:Keratin n=1 Tax=Nibea albiflora TaxID=240163 RepID=A0ACB7ER58_NIBAL|nr:Keratin [Nibea albiflora]